MGVARDRRVRGSLALVCEPLVAWCTRGRWKRRNGRRGLFLVREADVADATGNGAASRILGLIAEDAGHCLGQCPLGCVDLQVPLLRLLGQRGLNFGSVLSPGGVRVGGLVLIYNVLLVRVLLVGDPPNREALEVLRFGGLEEGA